MSDEPSDVTAAAEHVQSTSERLLRKGRAAAGVTGEDRTEPLRVVLRTHGIGMYPLIALGLLAFVDSLQGAGMGILGPDISRTLGISASQFAAFNLVGSAAMTVATVVIAHVVGRRPVRALIAIVTGFAWSIATLFTGLVRTPVSLALVNAVDGATSGSVSSLHTPLLMDSYPTGIRVRIISFYVLFLQVASLAVPLLIAFLTGVVDLTWRGYFLVAGVLSIVVAFASIRLRDPGFGRWDTQRIRSVAHSEPAVAATDEPDPQLGFFEVARRVMLMPTIRIAVATTVIGGMAAVPLHTYFNFYLADRWQLDATGRALFGAAVPALSLAIVPVLARVFDRRLTRDPASVIRLSAWLQVAAAVMLALAVLSPFLVPMAAAVALAGAIPVAITPALSTTFMSIVPSRLRPHLVALLSIAGVAAGGTAGVLFLGEVDSRLGLRAAILALTVPQVIGVLLLLRAARTVNTDLDRTVAAILEEEELTELRARGAHLPLLACRGIDFAYGPVQTLFDVDLHVDDGEMVALLGTNGAGKSTLLGVVSGLNLPTAGSVRLNGADITYLDTSRRSGLGIGQVSGGHAVFGSLTVAENLRMFGYSNGRDHRRTESGIEESFAAFPRLAERRNQLASTLSGGEQQMLGLAQALVLRPRLLCIDELSLGLAPVIVGQLMEMVRAINASGTSVVLVEQSSSIALSLAHRAYFMERGQVRFEGAAAELRGRSDLLRSVFLEGATSRPTAESLS